MKSMIYKLAILVGLILVGIGIYLLLFPPKIHIKGTIKEEVTIDKLPFKATYELKEGEIVLLKFKDSFINETLIVNVTEGAVPYVVNISQTTNNTLVATVIKSPTVGTNTIVFKFTGKEAVAIVPKKSGEFVVNVDKVIIK